MLAEACGDDGCASPTIEAPGADAFAGGRIDARGFGRHEPGARDFLTGAALCIPRAAWDRVGPFDERLFLYYEDVEWCLRARAAGFALRVVPRGDRTPRRGQLDGRRRRARSGPTTRRATASGCCSACAVAPPRGARPPTRRRARCCVLREPVGRAKLLGVRDWAEGRMGRGPFPR